ncbi:ty3-gypsy retrotransposon protein [Tanacetum coccineum]
MGRLVLLSIRVGRIIGAFIASLIDENTAQIEALRAELQVATGVLQGRTGGGDDQGSLLQRSMRLDVPKFLGADPESWLFSIQEYFTLLNTPIDQRLRIIWFNLKGSAAEWFRWMTRNGLIIDWPRFEESVKNRFGPSKYEDPQGALSKLLQTTTIAEYQGEFEKLMNRVTDISETLLISFYISGLKLPLQRELLVSKPTTLRDAFALACVTEARLEDQGTVAITPKSASNSGGAPYQRSPSVVKTPLLSTPPKTTINPTGKLLAIKWISPAERPNCLSKGEELATGEDKVVESGDISILNSLVGHGSPRSLQLWGKIGTTGVHVLIDNGSTHNFVRPDVVERMCLPLEATKAFKVYIGSGETLLCENVCSWVTLYMQGLEVEVTHDYAHQIMEFVLGATTYMLKGDESLRMKKISLHRMQALLDMEGVYGIYECHGYALQGESNTGFGLMGSKCVFGVGELEYLGHIISAREVQMDPRKIEVVREWPVPKNQRQVRGFFRSRGVLSAVYSGVCINSISLNRFAKTRLVQVGGNGGSGLRITQQQLSNAPLLSLSNFDQIFMIEADASGDGIGAVLMQGNRPILYYFQNVRGGARDAGWLPLSEGNLFCIVEAVYKWRQYLLECRFIIRTDHKSMKELMQQVIQTPLQQKYVRKLMRFDFEIEYKPGVANQAADVLSRMCGRETRSGGRGFFVLSNSSGILWVDLHDENVTLGTYWNLHRKSDIKQVSKLRHYGLEEFHATHSAGLWGIKKDIGWGCRLCLFLERMRMSVEEGNNHSSAWFAIPKPTVYRTSRGEGGEKAWDDIQVVLGFWGGKEGFMGSDHEQEHQFLVKHSKCVFGAGELKYLGHIISARGFIRGNASIASPLTDLLKHDGFKWGETEIFMIEADASSDRIGAVLMQGNPISYFSRKLGPRMRVAATYQKELFVIVEAVYKWRQYLLRRRFIIRTDHKSIKELMQQVIQTPLQQKYVRKLMGFDFEIEYKPGVANQAADALSRVCEETDQVTATFLSLSQPLVGFMGDLRGENETLADLLELHRKLDQGEVLSGFRRENGLLLYNNRYYLGQESKLKTLLLEEFHATPSAGHGGIKKTLVGLSALFFWKGMRKSVEEFIKKCLVCQQTKYSTDAPGGYLQPLPTPTAVWEDVTMDFITGLPASQGLTVILVVVDRLTKYAYFGALPTGFNAHRVAEAFLEIVVKHHGIPKTIISDRDPIFVSSFWKQLFHFSGTQLSHSTAYHPQTDRQTEVVNRCLEQYLRAMVSHCPQQWVRYLPWAEYCYNSSYHSSIKMSPFQALYGRLPLSVIPYPPGSLKVAAVDKLLVDRDGLLRQLKDSLLSAKQRMEVKANRKRRDVEFNVGDMVLVKLQPYRQITLAKRLSNKLAKRYYGPYTVEARMGKVAYRLTLPASSKIHPVFHVSILKAFFGNSSEVVTNLPEEFQDGQPVEQPLAICGTRVVLRNGRPDEQILVQWIGESPEETT